MTWNVTWPILVDVKNLLDGEGADLTAQDAAVALRALADQIERHPEHLRKVFGQAVNAVVEDRWVLRPVQGAENAWGRDGRIYRGKPKGLPAAMALGSGEILERGLRPAPDAIWARPENLFGLPVIGTFEDAAGTAVGRLDLRDWMAWSDDAEISAAIRSGWDFSEPARIAEQDAEAFGREEPDPLSGDANVLLAKDLGWARLVILEADQDRARAFLAELRPGLLPLPDNRPDL